MHATTIAATKKFIETMKNEWTTGVKHQSSHKRSLKISNWSYESRSNNFCNGRSLLALSVLYKLILSKYLDC